MKQLKELVNSELQKYAEELINEVASVSRELYVVSILNGSIMTVIVICMLEHTLCT